MKNIQGIYAPKLNSSKRFIRFGEGGLVTVGEIERADSLLGDTKAHGEFVFFTQVFDVPKTAKFLSLLNEAKIPFLAKKSAESDIPNGRVIMILKKDFEAAEKVLDKIPVDAASKAIGDEIDFEASNDWLEKSFSKGGAVFGEFGKDATAWRLANYIYERYYSGASLDECVQFVNSDSITQFTPTEIKVKIASKLIPKGYVLVNEKYYFKAYAPAEGAQRPATVSGMSAEEKIQLLEMADLAWKHQILASNKTFEEWEKAFFEATSRAFPVYMLRLLYEAMKAKKYAQGGSVGGLEIAKLDTQAGDKKYGYCIVRPGSKLPESAIIEWKGELIKVSPYMLDTNNRTVWTDAFKAARRVVSYAKTREEAEKDLKETELNDLVIKVEDYLDEHKFKYDKRFVGKRVSIKVDSADFDLKNAHEIAKLGDGIDTSSQTNSNVWIINFNPEQFATGGMLPVRDRKIIRAISEATKKEVSGLSAAEIANRWNSERSAPELEHGKWTEAEVAENPEYFRNYLAMLLFENQLTEPEYMTYMKKGGRVPEKKPESIFITKAFIDGLSSGRKFEGGGGTGSNVVAFLKSFDQSKLPAKMSELIKMLLEDPEIENLDEGDDDFVELKGLLLKDFSHAIKQEEPLIVEPVVQVKIPHGIFYAKIKPFNEGEDWKKIKIIPDTAGEFTAGYALHEIGSSKQAGYLKKQQLQDLLDSGEYEIIPESEAIEIKQPTEPEEEKLQSKTAPSLSILETRLKIIDKMLAKDADNTILKTRKKIVESMIKKLSSAPIKYRAEIAANGENVWSNNAVQYDTPELAKDALDKLSTKWFGYNLSRVVPITTPEHEAVDMATQDIYQNFRKMETGGEIQPEKYKTDYGKDVKGFKAVWSKHKLPVVFAVEKNDGKVVSYTLITGVLKDGVLINATEAMDDWLANESEALDIAKKIATNKKYEHSRTLETGGEIGDGWRKEEVTDANILPVGKATFYFKDNILKAYIVSLMKKSLKADGWLVSWIVSPDNYTSAQEFIKNCLIGNTDSVGVFVEKPSKKDAEDLILAKDGVIVMNREDGVMASPKVFKSIADAGKFMEEFRKGYEKQGYYKNSRGEKINPEDIALEIMPKDKLFVDGGKVKSIIGNPPYESGGFLKDYLKERATKFAEELAAALGTIWEPRPDDHKNSVFDASLHFKDNTWGNLYDAMITPGPIIIFSYYNDPKQTQKHEIYESKVHDLSNVSEIEIALGEIIDNIKNKKPSAKYESGGVMDAKKFASGGAIDYKLTKTPSMDEAIIEKLNPAMVEFYVYATPDKKSLGQYAKYIGNGWIEVKSEDPGEAILFSETAGKAEAVRLDHKKGGRTGMVVQDFIRNNPRPNADYISKMEQGGAISNEDLIKIVEYAFNRMPNQHKVGPNGESSYDINSMIFKAKGNITSELWDIIKYAFNMIPNKRNVGPNGESSYDIASKLFRMKMGDGGPIKLTKEEDAQYGKLMGQFLTEGMSEKKAEAEAIKELKSHFPRLKDLIGPNTKIAVETMAGGGTIKDFIESHGFQKISTGGGFFAYTKSLPNGNYVMIVTETGNGLPKKMTDTVTLGVYVDKEEVTPIYVTDGTVERVLNDLTNYQFPSTKLNEEQSEAFDLVNGEFLEQGQDRDVARDLTVEEIKKRFPQLKDADRLQTITEARLNEATANEDEIEKIAKNFALEVYEEVGKEKLEEIVKLNDEEQDETICHSHDFMDANMAMDAALKRSGFDFEKSPSIFMSDDFVYLWNKAWGVAKEKDFYHKHIAELEAERKSGQLANGGKIWKEAKHLLSDVWKEAKHEGKFLYKKAKQKIHSATKP